MEISTHGDREAARKGAASELLIRDMETCAYLLEDKVRHAVHVLTLTFVHMRMQTEGGSVIQMCARASLNAYIFLAGEFADSLRIYPWRH